MSVSISTKLTLPQYSPSDLEKLTKHNPNVDNYNQYPVAKNNKDNTKKTKVIKLPRFFNKIIENRVNEVAMMVFFHIIHFFCQIFWKDYKVQFEKRTFEHNKRVEETKALKTDQKKLDAKIKKYFKKKQAEMTKSLLGLPKDAILPILKYLSPIDLANFAQTCKSANQLVAQKSLKY